MYRYFFLIFFIFLCVSCEDRGKRASDSIISEKKQKIPFDEIKWKAKQELDYPYREGMLKDLMSDPKWRKYKKDELLLILGKPNRIDNNYLFYTITQKRIGLWPLHTKTLVIKLADDGEINWMKIHE